MHVSYTLRCTNLVGRGGVGRGPECPCAHCAQCWCLCCSSDWASAGFRACSRHAPGQTRQLLLYLDQGNTCWRQRLVWHSRTRRSCGKGDRHSAWRRRIRGLLKLYSVGSQHQRGCCCYIWLCGACTCTWWFASDFRACRLPLHLTVLPLVLRKKQ